MVGGLWRVGCGGWPRWVWRRAVCVGGFGVCVCLVGVIGVCIFGVCV